MCRFPVSNPLAQELRIQLPRAGPAGNGLHQYDDRLEDLSAAAVKRETNGIAPWWAHRQLSLPGDLRPVIE
jgi:hypothetical protein